MILCLDYDGTYDIDKKFWDTFIHNAKKHNHKIFCLTMRYPEEIVDIPCEIIYTSRKAKKSFAMNYFMTHNIKPSCVIFIEDTPEFLFQDG
jgi:hypothetical protein